MPMWGKTPIAVFFIVTMADITEVILDIRHFQLNKCLQMAVS